MTISALNTHEFSVGEIVIAAYRLCGILSVDMVIRPSQASFGRDLLDLRLKALTAEGFLSRKVDFYETLISEGVTDYLMPASVADVVETAMYIAPGLSTTQATSETPIRQVSRDEWQTLSSKGAQSRPVLYYVHRASIPLLARLWPVPSATEDQATVRFQVHQWRADVADANATVDAEAYWEEYFVTYLASKLARANNLPLPTVSDLRSEAIDLLSRAKAMAMPRTNQQAILDHDTGWGNGIR